MMNYTQILLIGVFSVVCTATKWPFLPRPALFIGHDVAKGVKGHIWESRGDLFWVRHIPRCCDVTRSLCPSGKCGRKCVSVSCDHLLEMGLKILIRVFSIFSGGHQDLATSQHLDMRRTQNISQLLSQFECTMMLLISKYELCIVYKTYTNEYLKLEKGATQYHDQGDHGLKKDH